MLNMNHGECTKHENMLLLGFAGLYQIQDTEAHEEFREGAQWDLPAARLNTVPKVWNANCN